MSGTFPTSPGMASNNLKSNQPVVRDISSSGKTQTRINSGHLWEITCSYDVMTKAMFAPIAAFAMKQRGDSFQISLPNLETPQGAVTGTISVNGVPSSGDETINLDGFVAGTANVFKAGDIFKADSHSKVYMVTDDASAGADSKLTLESGGFSLLLESGGYLLLESSQQATVSITPPLIESIPNDTQITYNTVQFTVTLDDDVIEYATSAPTLSKFKIKLTESII